MQNKSKYSLLLSSTMLLLTACSNDDPLITPTIRAVVTPLSGKTTQTFVFDLSQSVSNTSKSAKLFTRWDWDGDGIWDTPFTRLLIYEHRFYAPGTWKPCLEMSNITGSSDTLRFTVPVTRGFSVPKPILTVTPRAGNIFTNFQLDASSTRDDEDSLNQLTFRWDFEGDGEWDTPFLSSPNATHIYNTTNQYNASVQVKDPSGLIASTFINISVTLMDPRLFTSFRCTPDSVTNDTLIIMDASESIDLDYPEKPLSYRWDWNNDQVWDTEWLKSPQTTHIFTEEYSHFVRLQVRSFRGLTNQCVKNIMVYHHNTAPKASFYVSTYTGNLNTLFYFDCWSTRDLESAPSGMFYRWDFDGDGKWDTSFQDSVVTTHRFSLPGTFKTVLQVKDPCGDVDTCSKIIHVTKGTNQTGIIQDTRIRNQSYGTVLIGDQWWFTRNLSLTDTTTLKQDTYSIWPPYFVYGDLRLSSDLASCCPEGWRVPTREDWVRLFSNYPDDRLFEALMPGGESDFGADLGGAGIGISITTAEYNGIGKYGYYWSTTKPAEQSSISYWVVTFDEPKQQVIKGFYTDNKVRYAVRCVKDTK